MRVPNLGAQVLTCGWRVSDLLKESGALPEWGKPRRVYEGEDSIHIVMGVSPKEPYTLVRIDLDEDQPQVAEAAPIMYVRVSKLVGSRDGHLVPIRDNVLPIDCDDIFENEIFEVVDDDTDLILVKRPVDEDLDDEVFTISRRYVRFLDRMPTSVELALCALAFDSPYEDDPDHPLYTDAVTDLLDEASCERWLLFPWDQTPAYYVTADLWEINRTLLNLPPAQAVLAIATARANRMPSCWGFSERFLQAFQAGEWSHRSPLAYVEKMSQIAVREVEAVRIALETAKHTADSLFAMMQAVMESADEGEVATTLEADSASVDRLTFNPTFDLSSVLDIQKSIPLRDRLHPVIADRFDVRPGTRAYALWVDSKEARIEFFGLIDRDLNYRRSGPFTLDFSQALIESHSVLSSFHVGLNGDDAKAALLVDEDSRRLWVVDRLWFEEDPWARAEHLIGQSLN